MSNANFYKPGTWNAICDSCGFKFKATDLKRRWDGMIVDAACWETRNPQDFLRSVREYSNEMPWTRPDDNNEPASSSPLYVEQNYWDDMSAPGLDMFYVRQQ